MNNTVNHSGARETLLEVKDLSVIRSGSLILENIDLTVEKGEFLGLVGPNGGGKTTLLLAILGVLKAQKGTIEIYGQKPMSRKILGRIGWVSQAAANLPNHVKITVRELVNLGTLNLQNMVMFRGNKRRHKVQQVIEMVGLQDVANVDVARLSGGQRQRAVIAKALASDAELIFLDEPLVGIDRSSRNSLLKLLDNLCHDEDKTIVMISHDITAIRQTAHRMVYLEETIRYDGENENFPDFTSLANLRGIAHVHDDMKTGDGHYHETHKEEE